MSMIIDGTNGLTFNNATTQASAGSVLQVVNATTSTSVSTTTNSYIDTTLTATITPKFTTSKILVLVNQNGVTKNGAAGADVGLRLLRNSTTIQQLSLYGLYDGTTGAIYGATFSTSYLDSPATTSATTYKTQFQASENTGIVSVQVSAGNSTSTITLMEIAA